MRGARTKVAADRAAIPPVRPEGADRAAAEAAGAAGSKRQESPVFCLLAMKPRVGITVGDPAGIGPEIAGKAAAHPDVLSICEPVLYGPSTDKELAEFQPGRVTAAAGRAA